MLRGFFTIGSEHRFVDRLASGVLETFAGDPLALADVRILLPTRRSVRALQDAFLRASGGKALILPRLLPLGDVDEPELILDPGLAESELASELPPAMSLGLRDILLAQQVLRFRAGSEPVAAGPAQALQLARELGGLMDELYIEGVPFDRLEGIVETQFAEHWQRTLAFLRIVGENWPKILAERGLIDAIDRRNRLLRLQADAWRRNPPQSPVIVAGTTGSQPPTRALVITVATLPQGSIVLPGLDRDIDAASWAALDPTHPQYGLRELLAALDRTRDAVMDWPHAGSANPDRSILLSEMMRPAETTEIWSRRQRPPPQALAHVLRVDCATEHQEAVVAALVLRRGLDTPGRTAALVTPDRGLARRVVAELRRWNIDVDDSAGVPLADTPAATLLRLIARVVDEDFAPISLLALLKHPLCALGLPRATVLRRARRLDRKILRGPSPSPGIDSLRKLVGRQEIHDRTDIANLVERLRLGCAALVQLRARSEASATALLEATLAAGEAIAATDHRAGPDILWSGDAGEALSALLTEARRDFAELSTMAPDGWAALLGTILAPAVVRPRQPRQPRLHIWGPLEARLQRTDLVILAGLNEGTWPRLPDIGPWINRPMRRQLGLPQPERRIGQAAHDFISAFAADEVVLLRAERAEGAPTVPARWLSRLDALLGYEPSGQAVQPDYLERGGCWRDWAEALDRPATEAPWPRPEPRPPLSARPRQLSVSSVEQWRRDPYGLYARRILRLRRLDSLEAKPGAAERGEALHAIFHQFIRNHGGEIPDNAVELLLREGEQALALLLDSPSERAFWWPRFVRLAHWFVATERHRRMLGLRTALLESDGSVAIDGPAGPFTITARADRIDLLPDGLLDVIDYKTGRIPAPREIRALFAPQLLLEAIIAQSGGFAGLAPGSEVVLNYWQIDGREDGGRIAPIKGFETLVPQMLGVAKRLIAHFDNPQTAYAPLPWPSFGPYFNDYDHLERATEWSLRRSGNDGGQ